MQEIVYVKMEGSGDGSSWDKALGDLQEGINKAHEIAKNNNEIVRVHVAVGTYKPSSWPNGGTDDREKHFALKNGVTVVGGYSGEGDTKDEDPSKTILSGEGVTTADTDNAYRVFYHPKSAGLGNTAKLYNVTITKANASIDNGGGMYNDYSSPSLDNVTFKDNTATFGGGGMYNYNSSPSLDNVTFKDNTATCDGGGMYNYNSSPTLTNVTFTSNKANSGGGMCNCYSLPTLKDVTFTSNKANKYGGGMYNASNSSPTLTNVNFTNNEAKDGGGMYNRYSLPTLSNVNFDSNKAEYGGGIYNHESSPTLKDVFFDRNKANRDGGGIFNDRSNPTLKYVLFESNKANKDGGGMFNYKSYPSLTNCRFLSNKAHNGNGMYEYESSSTLIDVVLDDLDLTYNKI